MSRTLACCLLLLAAPASLPAQDKGDPKVDPGDAKKAAELKWIKALVGDFMDAGFRGEYDQATVLLSAELRKALDGSTEPGRTFVGNRFGPHLISQGAKTWSLTSDEISPELDEAVVRGIAAGDDGMAEFTVRVTKENGKWRVHQFTVGNWKKKAKDSEKDKDKKQ
jgi:hypothetical protein